MSIPISPRLTTGHRFYGEQGKTVPYIGRFYRQRPWGTVVWISGIMFVFGVFHGHCVPRFLRGEARLIDLGDSIFELLTLPFRIGRAVGLFFREGFEKRKRSILGLSPYDPEEDLQRYLAEEAAAAKQIKQFIAEKARAAEEYAHHQRQTDLQRRVLETFQPGFHF